MAATTSVLLAALPAVIASPVGGPQATATFTADNHYALYTSTGGAFSLIGGNETGSAGSPGTHNWSLAETFAFIPGDFIFLAVWSDNASAQGLLGEIDFGANTWLRTGDLGWEVYNTGVAMGDGSAWPLAGTIASWNAAANAALAWKAPYVGPKNTPSVTPWGKIASISPGANWTWAPIAGGGSGSPLTTAGNGATALLFRAPVTVPAPGATALLAASGCLLLLRRRRD